MTSKSLDQLLIVVALVVYTILGFWMSERMMVFSEELIGVPSSPWHIATSSAASDGSIRLEPSCAGNVGRSLRLSASRPTLVLCSGERSLPLMTAPYFSGVFSWPLELLRGLHHDDPFTLRKLLLPLGAIVIVLVAACARRFGGSRVAALSALGMAVSPCFVLLHSMLTYFETLPVLLLAGAILVLVGCDSLAPDASEPARRVQTWRLVVAALLVGLAFLANIKTLFYIVPLLALALRMRVRLGAIRARQWLSMAVAASLPLVPIAIPIAMDPSMSYANDRGSSWKIALAESIRRPGKIFEAARDLVMFGSNTGAYLARTPVNVVAAIVGALVLGFVVVDTVRTWRRREGCIVTAACGSIIISYVGVVTLLYTDFPANYTPLAAVYGIAIGATAHRLASWAATAQRRRALVVAASIPLFATFAWATADEGRDLSEVVFVTNQRAERDLARWLVTHQDGSRVVSVNLLAGGVVDQLTGGRIQTLQLHAFLMPCENSRQVAEATRDACMLERFRALLATESHAPSLRVIFPTSMSLVRRRDAIVQAQRTQLAAAAAERGLDLRLEQTFYTPRNVPAVSVYRVAPAVH